MGRRGENTSLYQRRTNLRNSRRKLEELLAANFQDGAQLVTLTYSQDQNPPSLKLAALQLDAWRRSVKGITVSCAIYGPQSKPRTRVVILSTGLC